MMSDHVFGVHNSGLCSPLHMTYDRGSAVIGWANCSSTRQ